MRKICYNFKVENLNLMLFSSELPLLCYQHSLVDMSYILLEIFVLKRLQINEPSVDFLD